MTFFDYNKNLERAEQRTLNYGIEPDNKNIYELNKPEILNSKLINEIIGYIAKTNGENIFTSSSAECIKLTYNSYNYVNEIITSKKIFSAFNLTIGNVYRDKKKLFGSGENYFTGKLKSPNTKIKTENLHCWLTFDTGEILDLTLLTTNAILEKNLNTQGKILYGNPDEEGTIGRFTYWPIFFGRQYLEKSGILQRI